MSNMRINQYLSRCGYGSRRECEKLVTAGRVEINGHTAELSSTVDEHNDGVTLDGKPALPQKLVYYVYFKPVGVITTMRDEHGRECLGGVLARMGFPASVVPVGRLDYDSEGLLLLTNDGALALRLTHPRYEEYKEYRVEIKGHATAAVLKRLKEGVEIEGKTTAPAIVQNKGKIPGGMILYIKIREGRNRQIRRMMEAVGLEVARLTRTAIGPLKIGNMQPGAIRALSVGEIARLL